MAINEMNGKTLGGIRLKVSLARRQPVYNPEKSKPSTEISSSVENNSLSAPEAWSAIASNFSDGLDQKAKQKGRSVISYDDDDIYEPL